jgi:predicted PhzF superfamily epimerase YddE/YHI9
VTVRLTTLRVFVDSDGDHGNPVGIVVDEECRLNEAMRIAITKATGFSECVFIDDVAKHKIRIYTGQTEISFAGHAALGAAWFISHILGVDTSVLAGVEGDIEVATSDNILWVAAELRTTPPWWHERLEDTAELAALTGPQSPSQVHTQLWAWADERAGLVHSRTFASAWGIPEDEANGSGCMRLAAALGRELEVVHGAGSVIFARPSVPGMAQVGGRVAFVGEDEIEAA